MASPVDYLTAPLKIGPGSVRSRICFGPVETGLSVRKNYFELAEFFARRAENGAGLIVADSMPVSLRGSRCITLNGSLEGRRWAFGHRIITKAVHDKGALIYLPITHFGRDACHRLFEGPSAVYSSQFKRKPRAMSQRRIRHTFADFRRTALFAADSGYDGVVIDGSGGRLLNSFFVPATNHRSDEWGGSLPARLRFPLQVAKTVRQAVGSRIAVAYRISILDLIAEGATWNETAFLVAELDKAGIDAFIADVGWQESTIPARGPYTPDFAWAGLTRRLTTLTSKPVILGLQAQDPDKAADLLSGGTVAMVTMTRALTSDWELISKYRNGQLSQIRPWLPGDGRFFSAGKNFGCLVAPNPLQARIRPISRPKKVAVIGTGPAGIACALTLARRGHEVTLYEERAQIGGALVMAAMIPTRERWARLVSWYARNLSAFGVRIITGTRATAQTLATEGFSDVVLATGTTPFRPNISGLDNPCVMNYEELLLGHEPTGKMVAIIGNGNIAHEVAAYLVRDPKKPAVTLDEWMRIWGIGNPSEARGGIRGVQPEPPEPFRSVSMIGSGEPYPAGQEDWGRTVFDQMTLRIAGVREICQANIEQIDRHALQLTFGEQHRNPLTVRTNHVILCAGSVPNTELEADLRKNGKRSLVIGSARHKGISASQAIQEGIRTGNAI